MIRLFIFFLWLWGMGIIFFGLVAISDLAFARQIKTFPKRILVTAVWPFALLSSRGRKLLFQVVRETQERK